MTGFHIVEQIGDITFQVGVQGYPSFGSALLAAVDKAVSCDEDRELFVDGPGLDAPHPIDPQVRHRYA